jgi:Protein of unknown function (DUF4007)
LTVLIESAIELHGSFARHETFHPRYGWLKKGFDHACEDPGVFLREDATTVLGVGKNMVRAIRYWCLAYKVLDERRRDDNFRLFDLHPTDFGQRLLGDEGWDPYLEDPGSLWLLHWQLLRSPCRAPAWWALFNSSRSTQFGDAALVEELRRFRDEYESWEDVADGSLQKDVRCLLRMYGSVTQGRDLVEDSVDSPFAELELFRPLPGMKRQWSLHVGAKRSLPDAILAYACLDSTVMTSNGAKLVGVAGLARNAGSPGRVFALTEVAIHDALARYSEQYETPIQLTNAAGHLQLVLPADAEAAATTILDRYYARRRGRSRGKQ